MLGAGGMGEVYKTTDTRLQSTIAIKVLPDHVAGDPQRLARFQREAQNLFRVGRHLLRASYHRLPRTRSFCVWDAVTCAC